MKLRVLIAVPLLVFVALVIFKSCGGPVSAGAHSVKLTWANPVVPTGAGWVVGGTNVYKGTTPGGYVIGVHAIPMVAGQTYTDTDVQAGQTIYYNATTWCQPCDPGQQESAFAGEIKVIIPRDVVGPPNPPTAFAAPVVQ